MANAAGEVSFRREVHELDENCDEYGNVAISGNAIALLGNGSVNVQCAAADAEDNGHKRKPIESAVTCSWSCKIS